MNGRREPPVVSLAAGAIAALGATLVAGVLWAHAAPGDPRTGVFWAFGVALGFVLQRSRFCFASAFRDLFLFGSGRIMRGILAGLAVASAGFALLMWRMVPDPTLGMVAPEAHAVPLGLHLVLGGILFGVGMVLAGGCVSGSLYRIGEGYVASAVALMGILAGLGAGAHTWNFWWRASIARSPVVWLPAAGGYVGGLAVTFALLAVAYVLVVWRETRAGLPAAPSPVAPGPAAGSSLAAPSGAGLLDRLAVALAAVLVRGWSPTAGGVALGVLNVWLYLAHMPWGVTGELSRWAIGVLEIAGVGPGPLQGAGTLSGCALVGTRGPWISHALTLDVGMVAGAFAGALLAGEFRIRRPAERRRYVQALAGGLLMGYGASLAMGCTIGAFFSAIPSLALNGWVFAAALALGARVGVSVIRRIA
ncbi:MAG: YeeE/YedE family protein [Armatimonadota bacterium]|nr:YeeE/YedE family protein [Armatimonadota bacterium]